MVLPTVLIKDISPRSLSQRDDAVRFAAWLEWGFLFLRRAHGSLSVERAVTVATVFSGKS